MIFFFLILVSLDIMDKGWIVYLNFMDKVFIIFFCIWLFLILMISGFCIFDGCNMGWLRREVIFILLLNNVLIDLWLVCKILMIILVWLLVLYKYICLIIFSKRFYCYWSIRIDIFMYKNFFNS